MSTEKLMINQNQQIYYHQIAISYWKLLLKMLQKYPRTFRMQIHYGYREKSYVETEMHLLLKTLKAKDLQ